MRLDDGGREAPAQRAPGFAASLDGRAESFLRIREFSPTSFATNPIAEGNLRQSFGTSGHVPAYTCKEDVIGSHVPRARSYRSRLPT